MKKIIVISFLIILSTSIALADNGIQIFSKPGQYVDSQTKPDSSINKKQSEHTETKQDIINRLEDEVRPIPVSDRKANLAIYKKLLKLDPENEKYKRKVLYYSKPLPKKESSSKAKENYAEKVSPNYNPVFRLSEYSTAQNDLKRHLMNRYGDSYSTIELLLNAGMKDYKTLCALKSHPVGNRILTNLKTRYYPSFSTIKLLYKSNVESYNRLNSD